MKLSANDQSDKAFLLTSKFGSQGIVCPCPRAIYIHKIMKKKNCKKSEFNNIFLKLATNDQSDNAFLFTSKFCPHGVVCPCPRATYMYKLDSQVQELWEKYSSGEISTARLLRGCSRLYGPTDDDTTATRDVHVNGEDIVTRL